jgi:hypothetical protein
MQTIPALEDGPTSFGRTPAESSESKTVAWPMHRFSSFSELRVAVTRKIWSAAFARSLPSSFWTEQSRWNSIVNLLAGVLPEESEPRDENQKLAAYLRGRALNRFRSIYNDNGKLRVLIQVPTARLSMGGNSLFTNWVMGLTHMGVACETVETGYPVVDAVERFKPTILFTSDHPAFLKWIDWVRLARFRERNPMLLGLTASAEHDGMGPALPRLLKAKSRDVDFFVSFRDRHYIDEYLAEWKRHGFPVLSIPFSANPLWQHMVPVPRPVLDYVFFGSVNIEKARRYLSYFKNVVRNHKGILNGPGWGYDHLMIPTTSQPYAYACSAIGLNLHIPVSVDIANEVNERTYILACCGCFQLCDKPKILENVFPASAVPSAESASEYYEMFLEYLKNDAARAACVRHSLTGVYENHLIFHRMVAFIEGVRPFLKNLGVV